MTLTLDSFIKHLTADDDPACWQVVLETVLADVDKQPGILVEVGCCSHWLRPHGSRWSADGGFALPEGYGSGSGGWGSVAPPQLDWSIVLQWTGEAWEPVHRESLKHLLRVAIPARTARHQQAAVHTLWMTGKEKQRRYYGFRRKDGRWECTAVSGE
jgi:hypothetical protein